jgi:hypothetical protein
MTYSNPHKWEKMGLIYKPDNTIPWSVTHAQAPVAEYIEDKNIIRVYFATRNIDGLSLPTFIDLNADNPLEILHINESPLLDLGSLGTFDDRGVMPSWVVNRGDERWLYYIGWNVRDNISYHNSVGLAIASSSDDTFVRFSEGPLWDRDWKEPYFSASTCVLFDDGVWKNWYLSCTGWKVVNGKSEPRYHIKYAESEDGINWVREGKVAIDYKNEEEAGIVKASVVKENGRYLMWFSYRNFTNYRTDPKASYRIGYAESKDGIVWNRNDDLSGIDISASGWDSEMIAYPHVIKVKESYLMFYNGNGFGRSGFGYARLLKR